MSNETEKPIWPFFWIGGVIICLIPIFITEAPPFIFIIAAIVILFIFPYNFAREEEISESEKRNAIYNKLSYEERAMIRKLQKYNDLNEIEKEETRAQLNEKTDKYKYKNNTMGFENIMCPICGSKLTEFHPRSPWDNANDWNPIEHYRCEICKISPHNYFENDDGSYCIAWNWPSNGITN